MIEYVLLNAGKTIWEITEPQVSFWERRLMDAIPILVLAVIVLTIGAVWGLIGRIAKNRKNKPD